MALWLERTGEQITVLNCKPNMTDIEYRVVGRPDKTGVLDSYLYGFYADGGLEEKVDALISAGAIHAESPYITGTLKGHESIIRCAARSIEAGAKMLDKAAPDWHARVDMEKLSFLNCGIRSDILSLVFGSYFDGLKAIDYDNSELRERSINDGFNWGNPFVWGNDYAEIAKVFWYEEMEKRRGFVSPDTLKNARRAVTNPIY